jgi:hypothetical protein
MAKPLSPKPTAYRTPELLQPIQLLDLLELGGAAALPRGVGRTDQRAEACSALGPATPEALLRLMLDQEPVLGVLARQERKLDRLREGRRLQPADLFTQCIDLLPWHDRVCTSPADPL